MLSTAGTLRPQDPRPGSVPSGLPRHPARHSGAGPLWPRHRHRHRRVPPPVLLPVLSLSLLLLIVPSPQSFSQEYSDTPPTLSVVMSDGSAFVYRDHDGYAVVVGTVQNNDPVAFVKDVTIRADFFDDLSPNPLETVVGGTVLDVIPPGGMSPFAIRSVGPDTGISDASVSVLGFDSSAAKSREIAVRSDSMYLDGAELRLSGVLQNGGAPGADTRVHLALYDGFEPARIIGVYTAALDLIAPDAEAVFEFGEAIDSRAVGALLFAESDVFYSDFVDLRIPASQALTKLVSISDVTVRDTMGNSLSEIPVGSTVNIGSRASVQLLADDQDNVETPYTFYAQVKEFGKTPYVEFIGKYDGRFVGTGSQPHAIDWIPERAGQYFIETFVWDRGNTPLAEKGPVVLISVV